MKSWRISSLPKTRFRSCRASDLSKTSQIRNQFKNCRKLWETVRQGCSSLLKSRMTRQSSCRICLHSLPILSRLMTNSIMSSERERRDWSRCSSKSLSKRSSKCRKSQQYRRSHRSWWATLTRTLRRSKRSTLKTGRNTKKIFRKLKYCKSKCRFRAAQRLIKRVSRCRGMFRIWWSGTKWRNKSSLF